MNYQNINITIANVVEVIVLIDSPTPYTDHILISIDKKLKPCFVSLSCHPSHNHPSLNIKITCKGSRRQEGVGRNPIRA